MDDNVLSREAQATFFDEPIDLKQIRLGGIILGMTKPADDLEAVRIVVDAVQGFQADEQQRIFRWAAEKLGLPHPFGSAPPISTPPSNLPASVPPSEGGTPPQRPDAGSQDIKSFVNAKNPHNDVQFAATVAYYLQFEAPQSERRNSINKEDLQDACRKAGRPRLADPYKTLHNAHILGLLDKGPEKATFSINSVGENLVAMTLPGDGKPTPRSANKRAKNGSRSPRNKKAIQKKQATKAPRA